MAVRDAESVAPWDRFPIPRYAMLDVWMALGGEPAAFDRMCNEPRRTPADTWAQLMAAIRNDMVTLLADTNPPMGPEFVALLTEGELIDGFGGWRMRRWKARALIAEADAQRFKDDYIGACQQIAQMHAAAFGGEIRGPARGVIEDIEDLYARAHNDGSECGR